MLEISSETFENVVVYRLSGSIDRMEGERLVREISPSEVYHHVLDFEHVVFVDSSGLGYLVRLIQSHRNVRRRVALCNVSTMVKNVLKITRVDQMVQIADSRDEAVALLQHD